MTSKGILLNPRLPEREAAVLRRGWESVGESAFPGHVAVATSGSSGAASKLVALSQDALESSARAMNLRLRCGVSDVWYKTLPDFHVGGLGIRVRARLAGCAVVEARSEDKWNPQSFASAVESCAATLASLVPTQLYDLARAGVHAPSCLRALVIGGGALAEPVRAAAHALGWPLLASYGLSECASTVAIADEHTNEEAPPLRLLSHIEARVGDDGRLLLKSPALFSGYILFDGEPRAVDPKCEGWFTTEDRAVLHGAVLEPLGRDLDFIKIAGEQSSLAKLEAEFDRARIELGSSADAALIAFADERLGHAIHMLCAIANLAEAPTLAAIYDRGVLPFERVRKIHACERVPRSPLGKVLRSEALALVAASSHA